MDKEDFIREYKPAPNSLLWRCMMDKENFIAEHKPEDCIAHPEDCISHKELIVKDLERSLDLLGKGLASGLTGEEVKWIRKSLGLKKIQFCLIFGYPMVSIDTNEGEGMLIAQSHLLHKLVFPVVQYALLKAREDLELENDK